LAQSQQTVQLLDSDRPVHNVQQLPALFVQQREEGMVQGGTLLRNMQFLVVAHIRHVLAANLLALQRHHRIHHGFDQSQQLLQTSTERTAFNALLLVLQQGQMQQVHHEVPEEDDMVLVVDVGRPA
jgi:hypothetical protein